MLNIAIVVIAYNRPTSLIRILESLNNAKYDKSVDLIISIDKSNTNKVNEIANNYNWKFGNKTVISHEVNLGLKKHVLYCGSLSSKYDAIIMLEDDLVVSPDFYNYAYQSVAFFGSDEKIAGISLYKHTMNVNVGKRFDPLIDGYDNYFLQFASSWGQVWTKLQWELFENWYDDSITVDKNDNLSNHVISWSDKSWLKIFIKYMVVNDLYFSYPRDSLTTNFSDTGTHVEHKNSYYQRNLSLCEGKKYSFSIFRESICVYDSYFELIPQPNMLIKLGLENWLDCEFDLYGEKELEKIEAKYIFTIKRIKDDNDVDMSYSCEMWPPELNVINNNLSKEIPDFVLTSKDNVINEINEKYFWSDYYIGYISYKDFLNITFLNVRKVFVKLLGCLC